MLYKIGDVSRILGISTDLIRYYEKKGVVTPTKDKNNDYRYYDTWDINFLIDCIWHKNFGFGIDTIANMVSASPYDSLLSQVEEKRDEIEEQIQRQQLLLQRLGAHCERLAGLRDYLGKCDICQSPENVCYLNRYTLSYDSSTASQNLSRKWMQYMPFAERYFEITREDLLGSGKDYAWGFSLEMEYVKQFGVEVKPPVAYYAPKRSVHSAFKSAGKNAFTPKHLDYMLRYIEENGLRLCGNARGNLVCSVLEDGVVTGYFEVWLPVEE